MSHQYRQTSEAFKHFVEDLEEELLEKSGRDRSPLRQALRAYFNIQGRTLVEITPQVCEIEAEKQN